MVYWVLFFLSMLIGVSELIVTQLKIDKDNLTSQETIHKFANDVDAELTIMQNGMLFFQDAGRKKTLIYNLLDKLPKGNLITDLN